MPKSNKIITVTLLIATLLAVGLFAITRDNDSVSKTGTSNQTTNSPAPTTPSEPRDPTKEQLLFLIEEEKLAHDVYTAMFQKYGAKVFGNILESESTHQARVLTLLQSRSIADPRSSQLGVFQNSDLQTFYDSLIAQGNQSAIMAYKAGVAVEERDIKDISTQLATATDEDVISALEALRSASENHLRAFNRQL